MTKREYEEKSRKIADMAVGAAAGAALLILDSQYIASLEAENAKLEKAAIVWHKYPEEKPSLCNTYLVMITGYDQPTIMFWSDTEWLYNDDMCYKIEITHWASLPQPPRRVK